MNYSIVAEMNAIRRDFRMLRKRDPSISYWPLDHNQSRFSTPLFSNGPASRPLLSESLSRRFLSTTISLSIFYPLSPSTHSPASKKKNYSKLFHYSIISISSKNLFIIYSNRYRLHSIASFFTLLARKRRRISLVFVIKKKKKKRKKKENGDAFCIRSTVSLAHNRCASRDLSSR